MSSEASSGRASLSGILLIIAFFVCVGLAIASALVTDDETLCIAENICVQADYALFFAAVAALIGIIWLAHPQNTTGNAAQGAAIAILGVFAVVAVMGDNLNIGGVGPRGDDQGTRGDGDENLRAQLEQSIETARELELESDLSYEGQLLLENKVGAAFFELKRPARLRIDVMAASHGDPFTELYKGEDPDDLLSVASNDDGGQDLNSRIEESLEPGKYYIVVQNISDSGELAARQSFDVKITDVSIDNTPENRSTRLSLAEDTAIFSYDGKTQADGTDGDFLIEVAPNDAPTCLIIDVTPLGLSNTHPRFRDTFIELLDDRNAVLETNDDRGEEDLGSRIVWTVPSANGSESTRFGLKVRAFSDDTEFDMFVELRVADADGSCPDPAQYARPEQPQ